MAILQRWKSAALMAIWRLDGPETRLLAKARLKQKLRMQANRPKHPFTLMPRRLRKTRSIARS
jgi:hydrogenase maturation factor HypF (carbamoyltransferase family)